MADDDFRWRRVWALFTAHRAAVVGVLSLVLVTSVLGIVNPLLIQRVFDDALFPDGGAGSPDLGLLVTLSVVMVGITIVSTGFGVWQTVLSNQLGQRVLSDLRTRVYSHLQALSLSFYASARTGDLQSRISNDVGGVQTAVTSTLTSILANVVTFAGAVIAMLVLSWQLTLLSLAVTPLFVLATRWVGSRRKTYTRQAQVAKADMNIVTQETLSVSGFTLARLFGQSGREVSRFEEANTTLAAVSVRQQVIGSAFFTVVQAFLGTTPVIIYLVAGFLADGGSDLSAGTIVAFTTLQTRLFFPVARMLETVVELQSSGAMFGRIFTYLDLEPDVVEAEVPVALADGDLVGRLTFDEVHFSYPVGEDERASEALTGISFEASPGQLIAFVGPSGAGKSTILQLVPRLYDVDRGRVTIDGHDVREIAFRDLSRAIGMVTQESYLFADTLRANIAYGRPDATDADVEKAARAAAIHDRIMEFDDGYDTVVGERGFRLSGGEKQRIAIARVLLHDPRVLVLDEATSALDTASERRIQEALGELTSGRTTLAVAHRLSTIQAADVIHVVDRGRIVESGDHEALLARGGVYAELHHEQFGDGEIETTCADGVVLRNGEFRPHAHPHATGERHLVRRPG